LGSPGRVNLDWKREFQIRPTAGGKLGAMRFADRTDAGRRLAAELAHLRGRDVVVLALPRGGVPVADPVAEDLGAPLDVIVVRKLGVPFQPELAMGAIGEGGVSVVNAEMVRAAGVTPGQLDEVRRREGEELDRRARRFRGDRAPLSVADRLVVVVDDGIATGSTARAAGQVARARGAAGVILAVPVAPPDVTTALAQEFDDVVCVAMPARLGAVGEWYRDFSPTSDEEVVRILARAEQRSRA
jgi:putative phosphoribosyl transferase